MKLTKVTWLCDECGEEFSRDVIEVITDDEENVAVRVALLEGEDGPLCPCLTTEDTEEVA